MFQFQVFVEEIISDFLAFFRRKKLSEEDVEKARTAFRLFLSAWQFVEAGTLDEIISQSYLSAVKKICCLPIAAGKAIP